MYEVYNVVYARYGTKIVHEYHSSGMISSIMGEYGRKVSLLIGDVARYLLEARLSILRVPAARPPSVVRDSEVEHVSHRQHLVTPRHVMSCDGCDVADVTDVTWRDVTARVVHGVDRVKNRGG